MVRDTTTKDEIPVPCGKCPTCLARRASAWSFRLMKEGRNAHSSHFVTLTYNTDYVPISPNGFMTLRRSDVQKFMKRLRKWTPDVKIKYYAAGEYGTKNWRPHYHLILFNSEPEHIVRAWMTDKDNKGNPLPKPVPLGDVHFGTVTGASIGYTLKYMTKPGRIPMHQNDDREPEKSLMSKGLGMEYLTPQMIAWHKADLENRMYMVIEGGKKISMPRYYKDKIYTDEERDLISCVAAKKHMEEEWKKMEQEGDQYEHNKKERTRAAFEKMYYKFKQGRNL